jgi:type II secretory pathway component GspD/PulD (secretin)
MWGTRGLQIALAVMVCLSQRGWAEEVITPKSTPLLAVDREATPPGERDPECRPNLPRRDTVAELELYKTAGKILQQPIYANFQNADLDWVLSTLFLSTGVNIVADPAATKDRKVTLHVNDMALEDVLDFIVRNNDGIQYSVKKGSIWITATDANSMKKLMYSRIYPLHFGLLSTKSGGGGGGGMEDSAKTPTDASSGRSGNPARTSDGAKPRAPAAGPAGTQGTADDKGSYLEAVLEWTKAKQDPQIFPEGSDYIVDRQSNQIIVYTTPAGHQHILELLDHFDQPALQVLIQTRFLDISDELERSLGLNVDSVATRTDNGRNPFQAISINSAGKGIPGFLPGALGPGSVLSYIGRRTDPQFQATLTALLNDRKTKVLSQPQILAVNNKESIIDISTEFQYVDSIEPVFTTVPAGIGSVVSQQSGYRPVFLPRDVGFKLIVTPSIGRDLKHVNLHLTPLIDALAQGQQVQDFQNVQFNNSQTNQAFAFPKPTIDKTKFETDVTLDDDGYVVLGGLVQKFEEVRNRKVPGLSSIPFIGEVFKTTSRNMRRRNLMIVVEVHIISADGRRYTPDEKK